MKHVFNDGGLAATKHRELNDCACRAIAIATERPYDEIWEEFKTLLEAEGPRRRSGVDESVQNKVMESLGWTWVATPSAKTYLREGDIPLGRLVVCIRGHSTAVIDNVIHDVFNCSRKRNGEPPVVYGYYKKGQAQARRGISDDQKKMYDLVVKILDLADRTDYEGEAETAKAKAVELIARYNIHINNIKDIEGFKLETEFRTGNMPSHEFSLLGSLGELCGVLVLATTRQHGDGRNYIFFGKSHDIEGFHYFRDSIFSQLERRLTEYLAANPHERRKSVSWKNSFADGFELKIKDLMRAAKVQQKALRKDLVLVSRHEQAKKEWECLFGKLGSPGYGYGGEYNPHGFEAGKNVSLSKGVKSDGPSRRISGPR